MTIAAIHRRHADAGQRVVADPEIGPGWGTGIDATAVRAHPPRTR